MFSNSRKAYQVTVSVTILQLTFNGFSKLVKGLMFLDNLSGVVVSFAERDSDIIILPKQ